MTPRLFLMSTMRFGCRGDRFTIGDPGKLEINLNTEPTFEFSDGDFDMKLTLSREQELLCQCVPPVLNCRVLFL